MNYIVTSNGKPDFFEDRVSVGDIKRYEFNFEPWLSDKGTITNTLWTVVSGNVGMTTNDQEALFSFNQPGILVATCQVTESNGESKKIWLNVKATENDQENS